MHRRNLLQMLGSTAALLGLGVLSNGCTHRTEPTQQNAHTPLPKLEVHTIACQNCRYCMPCPYGVDIPAAFVHNNAMIQKGLMPSDPTDPDYEKKCRAYVAHYDRITSDLRQADKCVGCKKCIPRCPEQIQIPDEMLYIAKTLLRVK